ncbi:MAG: asparagine synthase (glutamine-hydrolyzing) [Acutalibacteraceae bacterium]|nr:asparagine synthase (glutamine-hydrolyzing) [Acutalibacteraceae bacterium]
MCGIAGWLDRYTDLTEKQPIVESMLETMKSRGPDQKGVFFNLEKDVCLIHRRLTVIDPEGGIQPMTKQGKFGKCTIVYNGELYNTAELTQELKKAGYNFSTHSDTEVVLTAYLHWGENCVDKLNGIFAFAVYDRQNRKLFIARDRIGVKPFFYYQYKGGFLFASEIKTILKCPVVNPVVDEQGLMDIFFIGPGRSGGMGIFKDIYELLPGECGTYKDGIFKKRKYFKLTAKPHPHSKDETIEYTRYLLKDAITRQLVSDVPLCTFLSGGLDSSIISKFSSDYFKDNAKGKLTTYSVDYEDNAKYFKKSTFQPNSDSDYIQLMSEFADTNHRNIVLDNQSVFNALYDSVKARDLPAMTDVDSSLLLFCKEVKKDFTVALSGECADELFGGYPWYHNEKILFEDTFPWSRSLDIRRSVLKKDFLPKGEEYVRERYLSTVNSVDKLPDEGKLEGRMKEMFVLNFNWFMQGLLDRKDRCSMYSGLEVRVPFCDYRLVEYAYNMPWQLKALNGREKGIIRTAMDGILPNEIVWRKKSPYPKTHNPVYFKLCATAMKNLMKENSPIMQFLDADAVNRIIEKPNEISSPWYGQLMQAPQILAYLIQVDFWLKEYNVKVELS